MTRLTHPTPDEQRQIWRFWFLSLLGFIGIVWLFHTVLLPFAAAFVISYFLNPLVDKLERLRLPRWVAALSVLLGFILFLSSVFMLLAPLLKTQIALLVESLPREIDGLRQEWMPVLDGFASRLSPDDAAHIRGEAASWAGSAIQIIGTTVSNILSHSLALFDIVALVVIAPILSFYLLRDWTGLIARIDLLLPRGWAPTIREEARKIDETLAGYVRGQALVSSCLGVYYATCLSLSGLQFGLTIGIITGVLSFIPFVGTMTGLVTSIILALGQTQNSTQHLIAVLCIFLVGQLVEGNFLTPRLVGERTGLHPAWVIFAIMAGGSVFGFLGVLVALPFAATAGVLVRFAVRQYLASRYYA